MGEAVYYGKARFRSEDDIQEKYNALKSFFIEGKMAYEFWQDNRAKECNGEYWTTFREKFPMVSEYLEYIDLFGGDYNNALAGHLDFPDVSEGGTGGMEIEGSVIQFTDMVWHFADWTPILSFIEAKFDAISTGWVSDEYANYFDLVRV